MNSIINFPAVLSEDEKVKICKMLDEKDQEISNLYKEIIVLENKLERFNGSLTWKQSEDLKTQNSINNAIVLGIHKELKKHNLRAIQFSDPKSPNVSDIKLERIPLLERFSGWLKTLIPWELKRKSSN